MSLVLFSEMIFMAASHRFENKRSLASSICHSSRLPPTPPPSLPRPYPHTTPPQNRRFSTYPRHGSIGSADDALQVVNPTLPSSYRQPSGPQRPPTSLLSPNRRTSCCYRNLKHSERRCCLLLWRAFSPFSLWLGVGGPHDKERGRRETQE